MPTFAYVARCASTYAQVTGEIRARNVREATDRIQRRRLIPELVELAPGGESVRCPVVTPRRAVVVLLIIVVTAATMAVILL